MKTKKIKTSNNKILIGLTGRQGTGKTRLLTTLAAAGWSVGEETSDSQNNVFAEVEAPVPWHVTTADFESAQLAQLRKHLQGRVDGAKAIRHTIAAALVFIKDNSPLRDLMEAIDRTASQMSDVTQIPVGVRS